jgi:hypothetical protein
VELPATDICELPRGEDDDIGAPKHTPLTIVQVEQPADSNIRPLTFPLNATKQMS